MKRIRLKIIVAAIFLGLLFTGSVSFCQTKRIPGHKILKVSDYDRDTWFDINRIRMAVTNRGLFCVSDDFGAFEYPKGTGKIAIFTAGLWMIGYVGNELRGVIADYGTEWGPGIMRDGTFVLDNPDFMVYKVTNGDEAENPDFRHWMDKGANFGAPVDNNGRPVVFGDQTLWTVFNDANPALHSDGTGSTRPLGVEVRMTVFGYDRNDPVGDAVFIKWNVQNKGQNFIRDAYIAVWSDVDLGDAFNDLVGCDPERNLGYCYNADEKDKFYSVPNASIGFDILKGAVDENGNQLYMTSFVKYISGTDPRYIREAYNNAAGLGARGNQIIDPVTNLPTRYWTNGDPVSREGWIDTAPADRRLSLGTGPFNLAPGDEQEIIFAIIGAEGTNRHYAIQNLRYNDFYVQRFYDFDFKPPEKVPVPEITAFEGNKEILLSWNDNSETYNFKDFTFEGYNVYQLRKPDARNEKNKKRIFSFDVVNEIDRLEGFEFNSETGTFFQKAEQSLANGGIKRYLKIDKDYFFTGSYQDNFLLNGKPYYFAVTAFVVHNGDIIDYLESDIVPVKVIPRLPAPGYDYSEAITGTEQYAVHSRGKADNSFVKVEVVNPPELKDGDYKVTFREINGTPVWNLFFNTNPVLSNQDNFSGNYDYPVINGLLPRLKALKEIVTYRDTEVNEGSSIKLGGDAYTMGFVSGLAGNFWNGGENYRRYYGNDLEIRFTASGSYASEYNVLGDNTSFTGLKHVPYEVWNIEDGIQLSSVYYDNEPSNGEWRMEDKDHSIIINREYDKNAVYRPGLRSGVMHRFVMIRNLKRRYSGIRSGWFRIRTTVIPVMRLMGMGGESCFRLFRRNVPSGYLI